MNARSLTLAAVSALCAAFVATPAATAQAEAVGDPDTGGDMVAITDEGVVTPVPERSLNDVRATRLTYGATRVAIRVSFVDLKKVGEAQALNVDMYTNERSRRLQLNAFPFNWSGETQMYTVKWREVDCGGVRHTVDYAADIMKVSLPRRCLGNPRWVNFRVVAFAEDNGSYWDDALSDVPISTTDGNWLKWSGRVHRG
jgi:hypothetical protein